MNTLAIEQQLDSLFDRLGSHEQPTLVLTPNRRLSRYLRSQFNLFKQRDNQGAWPSLPCVSYQGWLQQQWQSWVLLGNPQGDHMPLDSVQELICWQQVIAEHPDTPELLNVPATARLAMQAYQLVEEFKLPLAEHDSLNTQMFQQWCLGFQEFCQRQQLISQADQGRLLAQGKLHSGNQKEFSADTHLILFGFDELTPLQRSLVERNSYEFFDLNIPGDVTRYEFADIGQEILSAAQWAQNTLRQNPQSRIGIVVPQLAQQRDRLERMFTQVFEPQYILPQQPQHANGFNLSAGQPLDQVPVVATAMTALALNRQRLDVDAISRLLCSPFIGSVDEIGERALLDLTLKDHEFELSLLRLVHEAGKLNDEFDRCPDFFQRLKSFQQSVTGSWQLPSQWAQLFNQQLKLLGWPGNRPLDTLEYQQVQVWRETLHKFDF